MTRLRKLAGGEDGAVAPLVLLCMVVLLGFMALVLDAGTLFVERTQLSKAVDAAALAGAQNISGPSSCSPDCAAAARQYAIANGVAAPEVVAADSGYVSVADGAGICTGAAPCPGWRVTAQRTIPLVFAPVLHITSGTAAASAVAINSPARSFDSSALLPYAVWGGNSFGGSDPLGLNPGDAVTYRVNHYQDANVQPFPGNQPNPNWGIDDEAFKGYFHDFSGVICTQYSADGSCTYQVADSKGGNACGQEPLGQIASLAASGTPGIFPVIGSANGQGGNNNFVIIGFIALKLEPPGCGDTPLTGHVVKWATWQAQPGGQALPGLPSVTVLKLWN